MAGKLVEWSAETARGVFTIYASKDGVWFRGTMNVSEVADLRIFKQTIELAWQEHELLAETT